MAQLYFDREAAMRKLRDDAYLLDRAHAVLQHQLGVGFCDCEVSKKYSELMMRLNEKELSNNGNG